jgi:DNA-binding CsgD family transcriptional regulator
MKQQKRSIHLVTPTSRDAVRPLCNDGRNRAYVQQNPPRAGVVVVSHQHRVLIEAGSAKELLLNYFPLSASRELPAFLDEWLSNTRDTSNREMVIEGDDRRLLVTLVAKGSLSVLILTEERIPITEDSLRKLGLTPREAQVMNLVIQGKTNWEISRILGASLSTVDKHTEHIRYKLGAENRTTAIRIAMERLGFVI